MAEKIKALPALILLLCVVIAGAILISGMTDTPPVPEPEFSEDFHTGVVDPEVWALTKEGDIEEWVVDVIDIDPEEEDYRLRLGMTTIGTRDDTVKYLGVRSVQSVDLDSNREISFHLDWNNQSNGCYFTASFLLCPTVTDGNPEKENEWLKFEYIGVPPGKTARAVISSKSGGSVNYLFTDGWPAQRTGRQIGDQKIEIMLHDGILQVSENGTKLYQSEDTALKWGSAYIYLQISSHSNYPFREMYFDDLNVT